MSCGFFYKKFKIKLKMKISIINRYYQSEYIINKHLNTDYPLFSLFYTQIIFLQVLNVLSLKSSNPNYFAFYYINLLYCCTTFMRGYLNYRMMCYHNTPTTEILMQGAKTCGYLLIAGTAFHTSQSVYFIPPNKISNFYNIYSPLGRGYGAHSCSQLIAADILKGQMGNSFDPKLITDENLIISPSKLSHKYIEVRNKTFQEVGQHVMPKYSEIANTSRK